MNIDTTEGSMTVKYYVAICYNGEYIVDMSGETSAEYIEESWYEENYGSKCYECYIENRVARELANEIYHDVLNNIEVVDSIESQEMKELLYDKIINEIDEWNFELDTEILNIDIDFDYDDE